MYNFDTFQAFIQSTNGQPIGTGECWDYVNLLWNHLGSRYYTYPPSNPSSTNHGVKWGWINLEARTANTINHLTQITSLAYIKAGDVVITSGGEFGHAGFADETYNGSGYLYMYSQNYAGRRSVGRDYVDVSTFVGAWRYDAWNQPQPPTITSKTSRKPFNWAIYARKLREKRETM